MSVTDKIVLQREDLIEELKSRIPWAKEYDRQAKADYAQAKKDALVQFRANLKDAAKWTLEEAQRHYFNVKDDVRHPDCKESIEKRIKKVLAVLKVDSRKQVTITDNGHYNNDGFCFWVLTQDPELDKAEVCD